jgi:molybdopterin-binding protein
MAFATGACGTPSSHVRIDIGNGKIIAASITNEVFDGLGLKAGQEASAAITASDVMVASAWRSAQRAAAGARSAICCRAWVKAARLAVRIGK